MSNIHPTAIIDPQAEIGQNVTIGPFAEIRNNVVIGDGCQIGNGAIIFSGTRLGRECKVFHYAIVGEICQDLKFAGEETTAEIGDRTVIREFATIHRGTKEHWKTEIGSDCLIMAYVHVAHDCIIGDRVIISNATNLGGHVKVEDWAIIGGMCGVHQFSRIGCHALVGAYSRVTKDVPPYVLAGRDPLIYEGLNMVGMKRRGFTPETINELKEAYRLIYQSEYNFKDALLKIEETQTPGPEVQHVVQFIRASERGIIR